MTAESNKFVELFLLPRSNILDHVICVYFEIFQGTREISQPFIAKIARKVAGIAVNASIMSGGGENGGECSPLTALARHCLKIWPHTY